MPFKSAGELNTHLSSRSYVTGFSLSADDVKEFTSLTSIDKTSCPHVYRWALHIAALTGKSAADAISSGKAAAPSSSSGKSATKAAAPKAKAAPADDDDLFGDDDNEVNEDGETAEEAKATKARRDRMEQAKKLKEEKDAKDGKKKAEKAKPVEKSLMVFDVKPWEADTDLEMVWNKIKEYQQEGLVWGETFKLEPVAYGVKKLVMTCTIVDSMVLMDDVTDSIEALEDWVQSVQCVSMNKI